MGDFAEDSIEREWNEYINDMDADELDDFSSCYIPNRYTSTRHYSNEYPKIDDDTLQRILSSKDGFLIRKRNGRVNILATCVWQGPKSFLCKIEDFGYRADVGKKIFIPKSIVTYNKEEKLVIYIPDWAKPVYSEK